MGYKDLRTFLAKLEQEEQLIHYTDRVQPSPDIGQISCTVSKMGHYGPAIMLENIAGYKGKKVVVGVHGSWANHALMFDLPKDMGLKEQFQSLVQRWDSYPGEVTFVNKAPCQEVVHDKNINLYELMPLYRINRLDGGCYISKGVMVTAEPFRPNNLDTTNVGMYRLQVQAPNTMGLQLAPFHDAGEHYAQAEKEDKPLPVAICIGVDPLLAFMASTPIAYNESEFKYAAALGNFTYELTKSLDADLPIPAHSEYVLEGEIIPNRRTVEGPFGEFTGSYSGVRNQIPVKIHKVTHRRDPIYESLYIGFPWSEADTLMALNTSVPLYKQLKALVPEVKAVNAIYQHGLTVIVSTDQRIPGHAKIIAFALSTTPHGEGYCRNIIIVDSNVDPFNLTEVIWALSTRVRPGMDVIEIPGCPGLVTNPADLEPRLGRKLIIDATTPVPPDKFKDSKVVFTDTKIEDWKRILTRMRNRV